MTYPWWLRSVGFGLGAALVAALFADVVFQVGRLVLPLSDATSERWADSPPTGLMCLAVAVLVTVFAIGVHLGRQDRTHSH